MCAPLVKRASFASLSLPPPTVLALILRRFVRFTRFFLPPYVSTHCPPPSLQWVSFPPKHPQCNWSRFLAAVPLGPAFLRPSNCSAACLPCAQLAQTGSTPKVPDRRYNAPQWPRHDTCGNRRGFAHRQTHKSSTQCVSVDLDVAEVF